MRCVPTVTQLQFRLCHHHQGDLPGGGYIEWGPDPAVIREESGKHLAVETDHRNPYDTTFDS